MKKRVVIVGGGINGLTAANYLQKQKTLMLKFWKKIII